MAVDLKKVYSGIVTVCTELIESAALKPGQILVLGCSSSEINGGVIGKAPSAETGETVIDAVLHVTKKHGIYLAVQGCEHINRALVVEYEAAEKYGLEIVNVVPALNAGGSCSLAAYNKAENPVLVEHICAHAGIDIGDTSIGMHIKFVQIPFRPSIKQIGEAHVSCLKSRPKLIGGERARYSK